MRARVGFVSEVQNSGGAALFIDLANCFDCGHTHHVPGTTGRQQGDGMEMTVYSLSQHPIISRTLARYPRARGAGFADDLTIYATLQTSLKVVVELRQRLTEDARLLQHGQDENLHPRCQPGTPP
jgi:hypothetical protein